MDHAEVSTIMQFEVQVPQQNNPQQVQTLVVEAPNWLFALRDSLKQLGEEPQVRNIMCDIKSEHSIRVTDATTGRIYEINQVTASAAQPVAAPAAAPMSNMNMPTGGKTEAFIPPVGFFESMAAQQNQANQVSTAPSEPAASAPIQVDTPAPLNEGGGHTIETQSVTEDNVGLPVAVAPPAAERIEEAAPKDTLPKEEPVASFKDPELQTFSNVGSQNEIGSNTEPIPEGALPPMPPMEESLPPTAAPTPQPVAAPAPQPGAAPAPAPEPVAMPVPAPAPVPAPQPVAAPAPQPVAAPAPQPVATPTPAPAQSSSSAISLSDLASGGEKSARYSPGMTTEILADACMRAMEIYDYGEDRHAAMQFVLDLALNNVGATGGSVLLTDINSPNQELWFEVASGPKADEIVNFRIPMGQGIVGFCAQEGVSLLIAEVQQDPRFANDIMKRIGLLPGSMLCVAIQHQKRVLGAIQLFNNAGDRPFTQGELSIVNYLAHTAGEYLISLV